MLHGCVLRIYLTGSTEKNEFTSNWNNPEGRNQNRVGKKKRGQCNWNKTGLATKIKEDNANETVANLIWTRQSKLWPHPIVYRRLSGHLAKGVSSMEKQDGTRSSNNAVPVTNGAAQQNTRTKSGCCLKSTRKEVVLEENQRWFGRVFVPRCGQVLWLGTKRRWISKQSSPGVNLGSMRQSGRHWTAPAVDS